MTKIEQLKDWIQSSRQHCLLWWRRRISSGIPDFRGTNGLSPGRHQVESMTIGLGQDGYVGKRAMIWEMA